MYQFAFGEDYSLIKIMYVCHQVDGRKFYKGNGYAVKSIEMEATRENKIFSFRFSRALMSWNNRTDLKIELKFEEMSLSQPSYEFLEENVITGIQYYEAALAKKN